ncbi:NAD(P)H-dependent oxidoreductase subunit E [candidate division KSB1 bacterium]|nr:NAD(P)H-dependent oxidoreductase subunit E [candidate division KSB1 bacterium]
MEFTVAEKQAIDNLRKRYPITRSLLLPVLWMIQTREGWISDEAVNLIARELQIPPIWVEEARTWYSMFQTEKRGKYVLEVCLNLSCVLLGSEDILAYLCEKLEVRPGATTQDGLFTVEAVECLGSCGTGPAMQVGGNYYDRLTPEKVDQIIEQLRQGQEIEQQPQAFPIYK